MKTLYMMSHTHLSSHTKIGDGPFFVIGVKGASAVDLDRFLTSYPTLKLVKRFPIVRNPKYLEEGMAGHELQPAIIDWAK